MQFMSDNCLHKLYYLGQAPLAAQAANNGGRAVALRRCFKNSMIPLQNAPIQSCVYHRLTHALFSAKQDKLSCKESLSY